MLQSSVTGRAYPHEIFPGETTPPTLWRCQWLDMVNLTCARGRSAARMFPKGILAKWISRHLQTPHILPGRRATKRIDARLLWIALAPSIVILSRLRCASVMRLTVSALVEQGVAARMFARRLHRISKGCFNAFAALQIAS